MKFSKTLSIVLLAASLAAFGCKKKDSAAPASADPPAATKPAEPGSAAAAPAAPATAPAAPAAPAAIASDDDYIAKASTMIDKMTETVKGAGTNCDKLAEDLTKMAADNEALVKGLGAYEKAHPDAKKKFDAAAKDKETAFETAAGPAMQACQGNKKVGEALDKLSGG